LGKAVEPPSFGDAAPAGELRDSVVLIRARGLRKSYGPVRAVQDLSFDVRSGEILGLLGPNGAGKSTTLRMLIGYQFPDAGTIALNGKDVFREGDEARADLGYLPEALPLYAEMSVRGYLSFFAGIKGVTSSRVAIDRVVDLLDLGAVIKRPCGNLSRGYRQRVGLAQALLADPSILILDEPTSGLDPNQIQDFRQLIRSLGHDRAILLSTHILPEALEICDRMLILNRGRTVAEGSPRELAAEAVSLHWARVRAHPAPSAEEMERFAMQQEDQPGVYRIRRDLDREEARRFLGLVIERGWDLLEWHTGAAGLESVFRRLTLGVER
jgi:ABC-2 type transport system ATP-binding protein